MVFADEERETMMTVIYVMQVSLSSGVQIDNIFYSIIINLRYILLQLFIKRTYNNIQTKKT